MPYFVVVRSQVKPPTIRAGDSHRLAIEVLPEAYDTLEAAEQAARQRAEGEQEWPWTSVYVVEAPNSGRARHAADPNEQEHARAYNAILQAALRDSEGHVPEPTQHLSAFQPPRVPPETPAPMLLPPASFAEPVVHAALEALRTAGFTVTPRGHSAYFEDRPTYIATPAARARAAAEVQRELQQLGGPAGLSREQQQWLAQLNQREMFKSADDVRGVVQSFELYQGDGDHDLGDVAVYEFRMAEGIDQFLNQVRQRVGQRERSTVQAGEQYSDGGAGDLRRLCRFRSERVLLMLRLWAPNDAEFAAAVAPLRSVLGPPTSPED